MCGILFARSLNGSKVQKAIKRRFQQQKTRGTQGFGYVTIDMGLVQGVERSAHEGGIMEALRHENAPAILFHHRTPTSVSNYKETTHPFFISDDRFKYDYYVVHNGSVQNWQTIYEKYKTQGFVFRTEVHKNQTISFPNQGNKVTQLENKIEINDSETLAYDLAHYFEGMSTKLESRGAIAFVALQVDKKSGQIYQLIWGRNEGNPLRVEKDKTLFCLRSEGKGTEEVPVDTFHYMDYVTGEITTEKDNVGEFYGRRGAGYNVPTDSRGSTTDRDDDYVKKDVKQIAQHSGRSTHERVLEPSHPMLPMGMGGSFRERMDITVKESKNAKLSPIQVKDIENVPSRHASRFHDFADTEPVIVYEDPRESDGMPESYANILLDASIALMDMSEGNNAQEIKTLRKELNICIAEYTQKLDEVEEAKQILDMSIDLGDHKNDVDAARALLLQTRLELRSKGQEIEGTGAELSSWLNG